MKVFFGCNESGVAWWRAKQPSQKMQELGLCDINCFSVYDTAPDEAENMVRQADLIYVPSPCGVEAVVEFVKYYRDGKKVVVDYDDNLFNCHPFNPGYKTLGLKEVKMRMPDGKEDFMWKDERKGFSLKDNQIRFNSHVDVLSVVDSITTTTPYLKQALLSNLDRSANDFRIVPNAIDFNLFKPFMSKVRNHKKLRIGWTASDSHLLEGIIFKQIVEKLYKDRNDFELVVLGNVEELRMALRSFPIEWHSFADLSIYPLKLASLELDIAICPLEDNEFNRCKSALKWSEFSAYSIPCVLSNVQPYRIIQDGKEGLLAKDSSSFCEQIYKLMDSPTLRTSIGQRAFERNYDEFNLDKIVYTWLDVFEEAMSKKRSLTYKGIPIQPLAEVSHNGSLKEVPV